MKIFTLEKIAQKFILTAIVFLTACTSLPNATIEQVNSRQVEYASINHNTVPVVFENGLGARFEWWAKVLSEISNDTTTFAYNRPGYGKSDLVATPRDGSHVVDELRELLKSKGLKPPYVLVGHSLGGLYMQLFARRYPDEVAALVLVDSTHPAQLQGKGARENWPAWFRLTYGVATSAVEKQELNAINATGEAVLALPSFTQKPVIILSALQPMEAKSELANDANEKRKDFVRLYPNAKQVWVDSGHDIPLDKPESVIAAIREVMAKIVSKNAKDKP